MPKPKLPPTPKGSTDLPALDHSKDLDMESMFTLPPPAMRSNEANARSHASKSTHGRTNSNVLGRHTPPTSPQDGPLNTSPRQKRTSSGAAKGSSDVLARDGPHNSYALPPPPSRARKIIQMKPKAQSLNTSSAVSDASYDLLSSSKSLLQSGSQNAVQNPSIALAPTTSNAAAKAVATVSVSNSTKRKQPSATSAAGRKIARKTAHSIIERRRRSKMNEEFGVLKDMIPACEGVEMHKLAILQAGIEYVRYLEGCVAQLKTDNNNLDGVPSSRPTGVVCAGSISRRTVCGDEDCAFDELADQEMDDDDDNDENEETNVCPELAPHSVILQTKPGHKRATSEWKLKDSCMSSMASVSGSSAYPSPCLQSQTQGIDAERRLPSPGGLQSITSALPRTSNQAGTMSGHVSSATPTPTFLSPAINSFHFSPDLSRTQTNNSTIRSSGSVQPSVPSTSTSWSTVNNPASGSFSVLSKPSPNMQPLPSPRMSLPMPHSAVATQQSPGPQYNASVLHELDRKNTQSPGALSDVSVTAEATASAALMMLTNDWRGVASIGEDSSLNRVRQKVKDKSKGMSVRDLLSSS